MNTDNPFDQVDVSAEQQDMLRTGANLANQLLYFGESHVKEGRYLSLFRTNLETAMMYLNKAISRDVISTKLPRETGERIPSNEEDQQNADSNSEAA